MTTKRKRKEDEGMKIKKQIIDEWLIRDQSGYVWPDPSESKSTSTPLR